MKPKKTIILFFILSAFISCEEQDNDPVICTLEFVYGINITLLDAETKTEITDTVQIVIKDDDYEETLQGESSTYYGAGERAGTYTITVTSEKYKTFISEPIEVTADVCHVKSVAKTIELTPKP